MSLRASRDGDVPLVVVFGPGGDTKGGISTFSSLALHAERRGLEVRRVVTHADAPLKHLWNFSRAAVTAAVIPKRPGVLYHINISWSGSTVRKYVIAAIARARGIPYVLNVRTGAYEPFYSGLRPWLQSRVRRLFQNAERVIVLGRDFADMFEKVVGIDSEAIVVVPNGVPGASELLKPSGPEGSLTFIYSGLLIPTKGAFDFLEALSELADVQGWRAVVAGDGELPKAKAQVAEAGLSEKVEFPGWVEHSEMRTMLNRAEVFVLPSYSEGLSFAVLEAMAEGCAVITTPVGAMVDVIEHGVDGLFVKPGDPQALAWEMRRLLEDPDRVSRLGVAAHRKWKSHYSDSVMMGRMTEVWKQAIG